jgi:Alginate export
VKQIFTSFHNFIAKQMKKRNINKRLLGVGLFFCLFFKNSSAQLAISAQIRTRGEIRNGSSTLKLIDAAPAGFLSQRSRLSFNYKLEKVTFGMSVQDVHVWGQDASTINYSDGAKLGVHEAWAETVLSDSLGLSLKVGRQELSYDDNRLLGNLDWLQQGRRHDVAVLKFKQKDWQVDLGAAFNQNSDAFGTAGTFYTAGNTPQYISNSKGYLVSVPTGFVPTNAAGAPVLTINPSTNGGQQMYKAIQYLYVAKKGQTYKASALIFKDDFAKFRLDTLKAADGGTVAGRKYDVTGVNSRITAGLLLNGTFNKRFNYWIGGYFQTGKNREGIELSAYTTTAFLGYTHNKWLIGLGYDLVSGNDMTTLTNAKDNKFDPLYGTPHKFWGAMDYFYVGTGGSPAGLSDPYLRLKYTFSPKLALGLDVHHFLLANNMPNKVADATGNTLLNKSLGTELDLIGTFALNKATFLEMGYCVMAGTNTLEYLKRTTTDKTEHIATWVYISLNFRPEIFPASR